MATLDELTQRSDLIHLSVRITKTLVSSAVAATLAEVCDVCVPLPLSLPLPHPTPLLLPLPVSVCVYL